MVTTAYGATADHYTIAHYQAICRSAREAARLKVARRYVHQAKYRYG
ncbi:MAG: hypothetical protein ACYDAR_06030 [Thermomicrobiales bacterium]